MIHSLSITESVLFSLTKVLTTGESFLTGGAGVGKTAVITIVYQMLIFQQIERGKPGWCRQSVARSSDIALYNMFNYHASRWFFCTRLWNPINSLSSYVNWMQSAFWWLMGNQMFNFIHQGLKQTPAWPFGEIIQNFLVGLKPISLQEASSVDKFTRINIGPVEIVKVNLTHRGYSKNVFSVFLYVFVLTC